jgi:redox-sensitive bicupin YhaK (pirin superfamily)
LKKQISFSGKGQRADIGDTIVYRILPNRYINAVGPFVFLDHIVPTVHYRPLKGDTGAHPHRGIATLSYILNGVDEHSDSYGNRARVSSGGVQWMNAGNGILHDEKFTVDPESNDNLMHGFQFWINLPSAIKTERPEYLALQAADIPWQTLENGKGWIKLIVGSYENLHSVIPNYSRQFLYHLHLEAEKQFVMTAEHGFECAAFLALGKAQVNDNDFGAGDFIEFDREDGTIEINNKSKEAVDILLFGGECYAEPIEASGPFVMNSKLEIAEAYRDFFAGKYGKIKAFNRTDRIKLTRKREFAVS